MIIFAYSLLLTKTLKNEGTIVEKLYITMVGYYPVVCRGGVYEIYHINARNIVCKNKHILVMCNCMVSMATHNVILKKGVYLQKYSYLSSNSYENNKLCTEVTRTMYTYFSYIQFAYS